MVTRANQSINQSNISFYGNVSDKTKETSQATLELVKQNVNLPEFFDGLEVKVGRNFSKIEYSNKIAKVSFFADLMGGCGFCLSGFNKEIYISEFNHRKYQFLSSLGGLFTTYLIRGEVRPEKLQTTIAHELGHVYSDFCIEETPDKINKYKNIITKKDVTQEEVDFVMNFVQTNGIEDTEEFKDLLYSDLEKVDMKDLKNKDIKYFVKEFYNIYNNERPTKEQINNGYYCRGEVFAQLFAYACGTDDGLKDFFTTKIFPNTYKFVQEFIKNPTELTMDNKITLPGEPLIFDENCIVSVDTVPATTPEEQNIEVVEIKPVAKVEQSCIAPVDFLA